jgi:hypothetical protein
MATAEELGVKHPSSKEAFYEEIYNSFNEMVSEVNN